MAVRPLSLALGGVIGLVLGALVCMLTYAGLISIPMRSLFAVTTVLITLLAAGMAAQAVAFLEKANWLTAMSNVVWDSSWLLDESSIPGKALHTLIGYTDQPTAMQLSVYVAVLAITFVLMRLSASQPQAAQPAQLVRMRRAQRNPSSASASDGFAGATHPTAKPASVPDAAWPAIRREPHRPAARRRPTARCS